ncbi:NAD(P)-binding protein [Lentibacillus amyloliquefaciens]|nr:NAD(P)-binding protein [Lentibacillus amyloliquefaciens]
MIELKEKNAVIVGGGRVAERRANTLLNNGASLTVVSPDAEEGIMQLAEQGKLVWKQKGFAGNDLGHAFLIVVATDDPAVNESVVKAASPDALINHAADSEQGNVQFPSFFRRGHLSISVSTDGASPMLAAGVKRDLQARYDESYEAYVDFLYACRQHLKQQSSLERSEQRDILRELLSTAYLNSDNQQKMYDYLEALTGRSPL